MPRWSQWLIAMLCTPLFLQSALAQERRITLAAAPELADSGLLQYILPRFSLKTGVRVTVIPLADHAAAHVLIVPRIDLNDAVAVFRRGDTLYAARTGPADAESTRIFTTRFLDWLVSDIGRRTIESFAPHGEPLYTAPGPDIAAALTAAPTADPHAGERLAFARCGRCHVIGPRNRMHGLGSTPSFAVLRTFGDWEQRFRSFYLRNPHPAFTQIAEVTEQFDPTRPSPIAPLILTIEELDAIVAFTAAIPPAELGAPLAGH